MTPKVTTGFEILIATRVRRTGPSGAARLVGTGLINAKDRALQDADGDLKAVLAAEIPSRENGGLAADGHSVTWKIKRDVKWHDGKPFTAGRPGL